MPVTNKGRIRVYVTAILDDVDCSDAEKAAAHAINCHDELVNAISDILDTQRGTSGRIIIERHQEDDLVELFKKARGEQ